MRLLAVLALLLAVISLAHTAKGVPAGEKPSFKDCQPHIDATIRDLAAKAVQAGEEPSEPDDIEIDVKQDDSDEVDSAEDTSDEDVSAELDDQIAKLHDKAKGGELHQDSKPKSDDKNKHKNDNKSPNDKKDKKEPKKEESRKSDKSKESDKPKKSDKPKREEKKDKRSDDKEKKVTEKKDKKDKKPESKASKQSDKPHKHKHHKDLAKEKPKQELKKHAKPADDRKKESKTKKPGKEEKPPKKEEKPQKPKEEPKPEKKVVEKPTKPEPKKDAGRKEVKIGIFDRFVDIIFGLPTHDRDEKYAKPWNLHPEFEEIEADKKDIFLKGKPTEPGIISKSINKIVMKIFGIEEGKRAKKWAQPWQTHSEHSKKEDPKQKVEKVKDTRKPWEKSFFKFSFMNKFIESIFGKVEGTRHPKFAQPWATHPEFRKSDQPKPTKKEVKETKKEIAKSHEKGGLVNYLVSLVFDIPSGKREQKWAKPWQTHQEFSDRDSKEKSQKPKEKVKTSTEAGIIGKSLNKFVYLIFEKVEGKRAAKWAKPWQTHAEHKQKQSSDEKPEKKVVKKSTESGIIGKALNSFVETIFGVHDQKRAAKWAEPWATHIVKQEKPKAKEIPKEPVYKPVKEDKPVKEPVKEEKKPQKEPPKEEKKSEKPAFKPPVKEEETEPQMKHYTKPISIKKEDLPEPVKEEEPKKKHEERREKEHHEKKHYKKHEEKKPAKKEKPKYREKIIEDDEQVVVVPTHIRSRDHIDEIFGILDYSQRSQTVAKNTLNDLKGIYDDAVKPLETTFKYQDISNRQLSNAELYGSPMILLLGPYSTGKSSFVNYLLDIEFTRRALKTGTPPSHGVFRIIQYGDHDRDLDGTDVSGQYMFSSLQKFGQNFVDQIKGKTLNVPLLKKVTFVEAPGILEMRRPNERAYPFNDVLQWFIDRADIILVMFDYTKLDAGYEMEAILDQLKGREAQTRILLNKADQVPPEELIKVQGSLFWNLSPLLGVSSPPVVYAGSYASFPYKESSPVKLFQAQEEALLYDIAKAINSRIENRISIVRRHAVRVRNHAQMVDTYLSTFYKNKGFLTSKHKLAEEIIENPHDYNIYEGVTLQTNVSRYDLPDAEIYQAFFNVHNLYDFKTLRQTCPFAGVCPLEKIDAAINKQLPQLMSKYRELRDAGKHDSSLPNSIRAGKTSEGGSHAHSQKL